MAAKELIALCIKELRRCWKPMALTDLVYKAIAFALLTPLVALPMRIAFAFSESDVLADQDIAFFFASPLGLVCLFITVSIWASIIAMELSAQLAILANSRESVSSVNEALRFVYSNKTRIIRLALRTVLYLILVTLPFLIIAGLIYFRFLTEFDINYYLKEKPPEFVWSVAVGSVLAVVWVLLVVRLFSSWFFALVLVLFEDVAPREALQASTQRTTGQRKTIFFWILAWLAASIAVSALFTSLVLLLGRLIIPDLQSSLSILTLSIGLALCCWIVVSVAVNLLSLLSFSALHFKLYQTIGGGPSNEQISHLTESATAAETGTWITRRRVAWGVIGILASAVLLGVLLVNSVRIDHDIQIIAHRGASKAAPENTMAAIRQAIEDGTDWVEIDVQETADGEVVVFHDSDFMKLAKNPLKIWEATAEDLKQIDIGSWFDPQFADQRVPTLRQVLEECKGKVGVYIELKYYGHDVDLENRIIQIVESLGMESDVVTMSLKLEAVEKMKQLRPDWKSGLLMSVAAGNTAKIRADFLAVNASFASRQMINRNHRDGKTVAVWTINDATTMLMMMGRGIDGVITDVPALANSVLEQRQKMTPGQRILIQLAEVVGITPRIAEQ